MTGMTRNDWDDSGRLGMTKMSRDDYRSLGMTRDD